MILPLSELLVSFRVGYPLESRCPVEVSELPILLVVLLPCQVLMHQDHVLPGKEPTHRTLVRRDRYAQELTPAALLVELGLERSTRTCFH